MATDSTAIWKRGNGWRQGCVLPDEAVAALRLAHPSEPERTCVIVISHDCDLAVDTPGVEDSVEVIVGRGLQKIDETLARTKSPRRLHLPMQRIGSDIVGIEIEATGKVTVPKAILAAWRPAPDYQLERKAWETLRTWLAIRYKRPAFPDEFDRRMEGANSAIAKIVDRHTKYVSALYFRIEPLAELAKDGAAPYKVTAYVLFEAGDDIEKARVVAEAAATEIRECFRRKFYDKEAKQWRGIQLLDALAQSENVVYVAQLKKLLERRLEYVSLKPDRPAAERPDI